MESFHPVLDAWPIILLATLSAIPSMAELAAVQKSLNGVPLAFFCALSISLLGATVGYITGISRVGIAGHLITAALSFVGAGTAYVFVISTPRNALIAAAMSISFALSVGSSSIYSGSIRSIDDFRKEVLLEEWELFGLHTEKCLSFILSEHYPPLAALEKTRIRAYCRQYVEFLR